MKRICTQIATFCLLVITQNVFAQSASLLSGDPSPISPSFGTNLAVNATNGFTSTNTGTFNDFKKGGTTTITSPDYYYTSDQSTVYFKINLNTATAGGGTNVAAPSVSFITSSGTVSFTTTALSVTTGTGLDYFFTITPYATQILANTSFRISLTLTVPNSDKTVTANTFATNATLGVAPIILPVKLVSFNGSLNKNTVQLQWLIADNQTADKFEIQRSTDGVSFTTASTMVATHKSGDENYSFSETASSGKVMYRLKMYDNNAKAEYSKVLAFNATAADQRSLQVLTNPVKDKLIISFSNATSESAQVHVYDNNGRLMQKQNLNVSQGINTTTIALNGNYRSGLYIVELVTKAGSLSQKIIYSNQ